MTTIAGATPRRDSGERRHFRLPNRLVPTPASVPWIVAVATVFVAGRGRLNYDTKYLLHVDAQSLMALSRHVWDPLQYGGYVAHQAIGYLWPAGPFHALGQWLDLSPWVMQRLWLALVFGTAGSGVHAWLRSRGHGQLASTVAALLYQTSPFVLAYQSRTSLMLIPWAVLGWLSLIVSRGVRGPAWRHSAVAAVLVGTAGGINATALLLVLPALALVAVDEIRSRRARVRDALVFTSRSILLSALLSLWWMATVVIQGRYGSRVLFFSETLEDVSLPATAFEVFRGFGYWLNYVGLDGAPVTSAAASSLGSSLSVAASLVFPLLAIAGLLVAEKATRRLAVTLVATGLLLAVNVHPITDPPRLWASVAGEPDSWLALAFRSSTRAIPVLLLGLCLGVATLLDWSRARRLPGATGRMSLAGGIAMLCALATVVAVPSRLTDGVADTTLSRKVNLPDSWVALGRHLESTVAATQRVLQLPGQEFAKYEWGYTGESALLAAQSRAILVRELLPLGDEQYMNLLGSVNDAAIEGRLDRPKLDDLARLMAVGAVVIPDDLDDEFYGTPEAETLIAENRLDAAGHVVDDIGGHLVLPTPHATGVLRRQDGETVVLGDGYGIVGASGWNLLGGRTTRYSGDIADDELAEVFAGADSVVVTDTNRIRSQHWRSTRESYGYSEDGSERTAPIRRDPGDRRLQVFPEARLADATLMQQRGPVTVRATHYGTPLRYLPESRPFASIDGFPTTAWSTDAAGDGRPVLVLEADRPVGAIRVVQEQTPSRRRIATVRVGVDGGPASEYTLDETSLTAAGQVLALPASGRVVRVQVSTTRTTDDETSRDTIGFAELDLGLGGSVEVGVLPTRGVQAVTAATRLSYVFARDRAPEWDPERSDPETRMRREFVTPGARRFVMMATVDPPAGVAQPSSLAIGVDDLIVRLDPLGESSPGRYVSEMLVDLAAGTHVVDTLDPALRVDEIVLTDDSSVSGGPDGTDETAGTDSTELAEVEMRSPTEITAVLSSCEAGCWLVFGESFSRGWSLDIGGADHGPPVRVDGGVNGWKLDRAPDGTRVTLRFRPQRVADIAQLLSLGTAVLCMAIIVGCRRRPGTGSPPASAPDDRSQTGSPGRVAVLSVALCGLVGSLVLPDQWTLMIATLAAVIVTRRRRSDDLVRTGLVGVIVSLVVGCLLIVRTPPPASFLWSLTADRVHGAIMAFMVMAFVGAVFEFDRSGLGTSPSDRHSPIETEGSS